MRILGIDFGEKRIGLAVSDLLGLTAQGLETVRYENREQFLSDLSKICADQKVGEIVIGLPVNMNGSMGPKAQEVLKLVPVLEEKLHLPVRTWDERLTSREAGRLMIEEGLSRKRQKETSDRLAVTILLQSYLESKRKPSNES